MQGVSFEVLFVCTGNICRSPAAEYLLRAVLDDSVQVTSAGTRALVGEPVDPQMVAQLPIDVSDFQASQLDPARVKSAGLILALTRDHRSRIVEMFPAAVRKTFTLQEFARILALPDVRIPTATAAEFLAQAVPLATRWRTRARAATPTEDDIADPYRHDDSVFATAFNEINTAVHQIGASRARNTSSAG